MKIRPLFKSIMETREYIKESWAKCLRNNKTENNAINLPYPYTSPCAEGLFDDMYYWDTYFINEGLYADGKHEIAYDNILNFCFLIDNYGFIPNSANYGMINRTQVPLFIMMCDNYYEKTHDSKSLEFMYIHMIIEYEFWMNNRTFKNTILNHYGNNADDPFKEFFASEFQNRVKNIIHKGFTKKEIGDNALAECESGWDFSPRFNQNALNYAPIDLNSIMYKNEMILYKFSKLLSKDGTIYYSRALERKKLINELFNCTDIFYDIDFKNQIHSEYLTAASLFPYALGISNDINGFRKTLNRLFMAKCLSSGENKKVESLYQWFYPNSWPPLVYFAFKAAIEINDYESAAKIAKSYVNSVDKEFETTNKLWEKYDSETGLKATLNEYSETEMLGWTAGTYSVLYDYLNLKGE